MSFGICFDFPELDGPIFAGGDLLTESIDQAHRFTGEDDALRRLARYPEDLSGYGAVIEFAEARS